ncbi:MAG: PulJ/GspJ family protein [Phycisphaerales bacterium]
MGCAARRRGGFTLIEAVLSLGILAVLMVTIGAAMSVMTRLMPSADDPRPAALSMSEAMEILQADVSSAVSVGTLDGESLKMVVAGAGAGGARAGVVYEFDGDAGTITRSVGGGAGVVLADSIDEASFFGIGSEVVVTPAVVGEVESSTLGSDAISCTNNDLVFESGRAVRQELSPTLRAGVTAWRVTGLTLRLKQHQFLSNGDCEVSFHRIDDDGVMTMEPIARFTVAISSMPSSLFAPSSTRYRVTDMPWISAGERVAFVMRPTDGGSFRSRAATSAGHPSLEILSDDWSSGTPLGGWLVCFGLTGEVEVGGSPPETMAALDVIGMKVDHRDLGVMRHVIRPMAPVVVRP